MTAARGVGLLAVIAAIAIVAAAARVASVAAASPAPAAQVPPASAVRPEGPARPGLTMRPADRGAHGGFVDDLDCSACHTTRGWQLAATAGASGFDHDRTGFGLRGAHVQAACGRCHTGQARPTASCEGCHRDPHQGRNDGGCADCHRATSWADTAALDLHRRTRLPLTGRHATIDCVACHRRTGERAYRDVPADCYGCHRAEYHAVQVHPVHDGSSGSPPLSRDCGQCHRATGWEPAIANPSGLASALARAGAPDPAHDAWFAITTGRHRGAACAACHPDPRRPRFARCDGCHADAALRAQHRRPVARAAVACLGCHPRGAAR